MAKPISTELKDDGQIVIDRAMLHDWRVGDLFIQVDGGKSYLVAKEIFAKHDNVFEISIRVNSMANIVARIYYKETEEVYALMEAIKAIPYVAKADFSEIIRLARKKNGVPVPILS